MAMSVRPGLVFPDQEVTVLFNSGGLGDSIARIPALKVIERDYPACQIHLLASKVLHEVLKRTLSRTKIYPYPPEKGMEMPERPGMFFGAKQQFHTTLGSHLVDYAFNILLDRSNIPMEDKSYPHLGDLSEERRQFGLPEKYVVLTPGFTSGVREMLPEICNEIAKGATARGLTPVFLGARTINIDTEAKFGDVDYSLGLDLRDKTSLVEAAAVAQGAVAVIGLDSGLIHVAGLTDVPIIAGYSSQLPELRMPIRHGELGWKVWPITPDTCHGCEPALRFVYKHDFRECYAGDKRCLKELSADKYLAALDSVLTSN
jgi:ADP-heptose:LPS heptosyltransferase